MCSISTSWPYPHEYSLQHECTCVPSVHHDPVHGLLVHVAPVLDGRALYTAKGDDKQVDAIEHSGHNHKVEGAVEAGAVLRRPQIRPVLLGQDVVPQVEVIQHHIDNDGRQGKETCGTENPYMVEIWLTYSHKNVGLNFKDCPIV